MNQRVRPWLLLCFLLSRHLISCSAATITGSLIDLTGSPIDTELFFRSMQPPLATGLNVVVPGSKKITTSGGNFTIYLIQGNYQIISDRLNGYITVPEGNATYNINQVWARYVAFLTPGGSGSSTNLDSNLITPTSGTLTVDGNNAITGGLNLSRFARGTYTNLTGLSPIYTANGPDGMINMSGNTVITLTDVQTTNAQKFSIIVFGNGSTLALSGPIITARFGLLPPTPPTTAPIVLAFEQIGTNLFLDVKGLPTRKIISGATPAISFNDGTYQTWTLSNNSTPTITDIPIAPDQPVPMELTIIQPAGQTYSIAVPEEVQFQGTDWSALPSNSTNTIVLKWTGSLPILAWWVEQPAPGNPGGGNVFGTGTPVDRAITIYSGTSGTNVIPSTATVDSSGNLISSGTVTIGSTNVAGALADKQHSFSTGAGVTNQNNVLSVNLAPGTYATFSTNSAGEITISPIASWDFSVTGTTTGNTATPIFTNALPANSISSYLAHIVSGTGTSGDTTNSTYLVRQAAYRYGASATLIGTNALSNIPASPGVSAGFVLDGSNVLLDVVGISGTTVTWAAKGHIFVVAFTTFNLLDNAGNNLQDNGGNNLERTH